MAKKPLEPIVTLQEETQFKKKTTAALAELPVFKSSDFETSPTNNMGEKLPILDYLTEVKAVENYEKIVIDSKGELKVLQLRKACTPDAGFIDQVSFTIDEIAIVKWLGRGLVTDQEYIRAISALCFELFGFGVTEACPNGRNFYNGTWKLGIDSALYGHVSFGGQRETVLIQITGTGANAALSGWENRLYHFLSNAHRARITRVDLARDFLNGEYSPTKAYRQYLKGAFNCGGSHPKCERVGSDWTPICFSGSGRTLYIGLRRSGKFTRIYEKGRQLGDKTSNWTRVECELHNEKRIIPLDVLLYPGQYLAACYPALEFISATPKRITTQLQRVEITYNHAMHYARLQVGRLINFMKERAHLSAEQIVETLQRKNSGFPKRLMDEALSADLCETAYLHQLEPDHPADYYHSPESYLASTFQL